MAEALSRKHGDIHVARESSGLHLYMPSPEVLEALLDLIDGKIADAPGDIMRNLLIRG